MTFSEPNAKEYAATDTATANTTEVPDVSAATKDPNGVPTGAWAVSFCGCLDTCVPNGASATVALAPTPWRHN
jgi:hypothetical protein